MIEGLTDNDLELVLKKYLYKLYEQNSKLKDVFKEEIGIEFVEEDVLKEMQEEE